jgi:O-antigen/teichoic acid export membrane protein
LRSIASALSLAFRRLSSFPQAGRRLASVLSDSNLTKKASLNSVASMVDYGAGVLVALLITPVILSGLGPYAFGMWQILLRATGYLSPASGRPTEALKWTLANRRASNDYTEKREFVGSALVVWLIFTPVVLGIGALLLWLAPSWFGVPPDRLFHVRVATGLLVLNVSMTSLAYIPQAVLQGENIAYKKLGLSTSFIFLGGGLVWLAVQLDTGLPGIAAATLLSTTLTGILSFAIARRYTRWFGIKLPSISATKRFLSLSFWFLVWHFVSLSLISSDVVLLGIFDAVTTAGDYTLTKYAPEAVITVVALMVAGIMPGLGGIIGSGQLDRAARVRSELLSVTWLFATAVCATILLYNRAFVVLWVGETHYLGTAVSVLVVLISMQAALYNNDAHIINLTLDIRSKVLIGLSASSFAIILSVVLMKYFDMGVVGLLLAFIAGKSILLVAYPLKMMRFLGLSVRRQLVGCIRPALVTSVLFGLAATVDAYRLQIDLLGPLGWVDLMLASGAGFLALLSVSYYGGLSQFQRARIIERLRELRTGARQ